MAKKKTAKKAVSKKFSNTKVFTAVAGTEPFLGRPRAIVIVCTCANTVPANLGRTLAELAVSGGPFQVCVHGGIRRTGYQMDINAIPNAPATKLIDVVNVIQHAPRA